MAVPNRYNVRVYGILINEKNQVLLSHEFRFGKEMLKFPGGGNEFGEGLKETLIREFDEEHKLQVEVGELFYINDFFQASAFRESDQLLSVYYEVRLADGESYPVNSELIGEGEVPLWKDLNELEAEQMTFPIDKIVAKKLKA